MKNPSPLELELTDGGGLFRIRHWRDVTTELHHVCERAFQLLSRNVNFDMGTLFLLDQDSQSLKAVKVMSGGETMDGEEEMPLTADSPLLRLMDGEKDSLALGAPHHAYFSLLEAFGHPLGVMRLDRWSARGALPATQRNFIQKLSRSLALAVWHTASAVQNRLMDNQLRTFNEVSVLIHQSLRLKRLLEDVAKKIVKNLGFDRVKVYLVDPKKKTLRGELGYAIFEGLTDISEELYPLKTGGGNPMVDLLLGNPRHPVADTYRETLRYIPLRSRNEIMGMFLVDNLLSQQPIAPEEIQLLETLAGQLGLAIKNAELYEGVEELAITDELTRVYLPRYFRERLDQECLRAARTGSSFSICMLDVDYFKRINDTYGHPIGDRVLQELARQLQITSRKIDVVCRYGGDEFIILLPNTNADQALQFAQRLRQNVHDLPFPLPHETALRVTVSMGIAVYPIHGTQAEELIRLADTALYESKAGGRNQARVVSVQSERGREIPGDQPQDEKSPEQT